METDEELEIRKLQEEKDEILVRLSEIKDIDNAWSLGEIVFNFQDIVKKLK